MQNIVRTQSEIEDQLLKAEDGETEGSKYPGMNYEQGMLAMYRWLVGEVEDLPLEED